MPLLIELLSVCDCDISYRGPLGDAAHICAATPVLVELAAAVDGPIVNLGHEGFEHMNAALSDSFLMVV